MRILIDYIDERIEELHSFLASMVVDPMDGQETVEKHCSDYLSACTEIETAMLEIIKRFGDMTLEECVRRFGHIEGQIESEG